MSPSNGTHPEGSQDNGLAPEELAPIAAVDGLGALTTAQAAQVRMDEVHEFEAAAGALFAAFALEKRSIQVPPPAVLERLDMATEQHLQSEGHAGRLSVPPAGPELNPVPRAALPERRGWQFGPVAAIAGWAAAAALLAGLLSTLGRVSDLELGLVKTEPKTQLAQFQVTAPDVVQLAWQPLGPGSNVKGEVIWSDDQNDGFMRINGLPVNDPEERQYQLWIFRGNDPAAEPHPVDGGVFDVASNGEVIIPIHAKLEVGRAGIFAVTVEKPGGVVVSGRDEIVALAQRAS